MLLLLQAAPGRTTGSTKKSESVIKGARGDRDPLNHTESPVSDLSNKL